MLDGPSSSKKSIELTLRLLLIFFYSARSVARSLFRHSLLSHVSPIIVGTEDRVERRAFRHKKVENPEYR
jgi:hypothetical protein